MEQRMKDRIRSGFSRRDFLKTSLMSSAALWMGGGAAEKKPLHLTSAPVLSSPPALTGIKVNDIHSQLNSALVSEVLHPTSLDQCRDILRATRQAKHALSIAGGRH